MKKTRMRDLPNVILEAVAVCAESCKVPERNSAQENVALVHMNTNLGIFAMIISKKKAKYIRRQRAFIAR